MGVSDLIFTMAAVSDPHAAKTIQLTLKELMKTLKKCDTTRKISEAGLDIANAQHKEVETEGMLSVANQGKLMKTYQQVIGEAEKEEEELRRAVEKNLSHQNFEK